MTSMDPREVDLDALIGTPQWQPAYDAMVAAKEADYEEGLAGSPDCPPYQVTTGPGGEFAVMLSPGLSQREVGLATGDVHRRFDALRDSGLAYPGGPDAFGDLLVPWPEDSPSPQ